MTSAAGQVVDMAGHVHGAVADRGSFDRVPSIALSVGQPSSWLDQDGSGTHGARPEAPPTPTLAGGTCLDHGVMESRSG